MNKQSDGTVVLLFGPQALGFQEQFFHNLRSNIHGNPENAWMRTVVAELPQYSQQMSRKLKKLRDSVAPLLLQKLAEWLNSDDQFPVSRDLPNVLLTPLVVLGQLAQYTQYVKAANVDAGLGLDCWSPQPGRVTLGFCTGLLGALAVSTASNKAEFERLGGVAIRLAMLVGALIDAEDECGPHGASKSLSVAWNTPNHKQELDAVLKAFPEAYISVYYDENRVTITTSTRSASALQQQLKKSGVVAVEIGLRGRFHAGCHQEDIDEAISFCDSIPGLQLPDASEIVLPTCSTASGEPMQSGKLHHIVLREMLLEPCRWGQAFESMATSHLKSKTSLVVSFGSEKCVPPSFVSLVSDRIIHMDDWAEAEPRLSALSAPTAPYSDDDIAVVGMSCKVSGADSPEELWDLMIRGESQHTEVPEERFTFETHWRDTDPKRKWYGNFLRDYDAFDHKFFKKSPREVASQDPQQRLFLQSAYQAVEQSGYFNSAEPDTRVGVFVGVCAADYEANVACYPPNAFTATGNLKSFIAGKISHYFGWTGPGLTIDTACSASAVAIHQGCRAILAGECTAALAGGVTVMTSPLWFQNLAGASFLSPTGSCKPFDSKADGYCRGEGIACVFLKKMSQAIQDGDPIMGSIRSSAVYQNENCTPIFVPNASSLSGLFGDVVRKARLQPKDVTLVEAHGTGTPVGDPAEYESIKRVFGGRAVRSTPMPIGSIKGLIGHTEATSGVMALIKVLLLLQKGMIPPQASFKTLNPAIHATPDDMLEVVTRLTPWKVEKRIALINNYGASGSNASMVVAQSPVFADTPTAPIHENGVRQPFWIPALDERSLREYCIHLQRYIKSQIAGAGNKISLANLSYNVARQSNRNLPLGLIFRCHSIQELEERLNSFIDGKATDGLIPKKNSRPVILCFGGQISRTIGLDRKLYESSTLLRKHLDNCNAILESLGFDSFYPAIFDNATVEDPVKLQSILFALQYSSAMSWINCGVQVSAIVGHSFGELTAQCISGQLSLRDSLRVVVARAELVREKWGPDSGAMMAVEADFGDVQVLLNKAAVACPSEPPAAIACYNGPRSFTLAGTTHAMAAVEQLANTETRVRGKMLSVSNAFHSTLVEPLQSRLKEIARGMKFREPSLRWERATEAPTSSKITPEFFATHMRDPVYADHAFQRLHKEYPSAIWLEAGSNSTITNMANKALGSPSHSHFQAVNLSSESSLQMMADVSVSLWKEGLKTHHWCHHPLQAPSYQVILLPPYQFEKHRHWLELKKPQKAIEQQVPQQPAPQDHLPTQLYTFTGYQDEAKRQARFRINTMIKQYEELVRGHVVAQTAAICPATVEVDIAIEALFSLRPDFEGSGLQPEIQNVENQAPICIDPARAVWLDTQATSADFRTWNWQIISTDAKGSTRTLHVQGQIVFRSVDDAQLKREFARCERLVDHQRCLDILNCSDPDDTIQGRNMYKVFAEIVEYDTPYHGLQKLVGKGSVSAGRVVKKSSGETWLDPHLADCFSQVGGFWVNCMTDRSPTDMYIAAGFESWIRSPTVNVEVNNANEPTTWHVMATHHKASEKAYTTDIFIFNAVTGSLHEVILGINYARIPKAVMRKTLLRLTAANETTETTAATISTAARMPPPPQVSTSTVNKQTAPASIVTTAMLSEALIDLASKSPQQPAASNPPPGLKLFETVAEILVELSGLERDAIALKTNLADIGIDSLMGMEMAHELEGAFKCTLDTDHLAEVMTVQDVVDCVAAALGMDASAMDSDADAIQMSESSSGESTSSPDHAQSVTSVSDNESKQSDELQLPASTVLEAFGESKLLTDKFIADYNCAGYMDNINPKQTQLCIALTLDAFEELGCSIKSARPGQVLERVPHVPQHGRLVRYLYEMLETDARLIDVDDQKITRTAVSAPTKSSKELLNNLIAAYPDHIFATRLAYYCGSRLADVLRGNVDGVKLIFGSDQGRELVSGLYGDSLLNKLSYKQMEDIVKRIVAKLPPDSGPLKILEMGAGTGGTTKYLVPLLLELKVPVEYTFTDLSPSFIAAARKKYKAYPFMRFRQHDIEKEPAEDLLGTQHLVVASNAVHATHSLAISTKNIRKALRPDGFLMMLEMTETLRWVDIIFGLLEGWWLFDDERPHALSHQSHWDRELHSVGYGHVDWTDGQSPEARIQRIIIALASGPRHERLPVHEQRISPPTISDTTDRAAAVEAYVQKYTSEFAPPAKAAPVQISPSAARCVLVTGATGSLGSHIVAHLVAMSEVATTVICLNRLTRRSEPLVRQHKAFADHRIHLDADSLSKLKIYESDSSKPQLGLTSDEYTGLVESVTHIVHNAWPMSGNRPISGFEAQFQVMRNLIDLSSDIRATTGRVVTFQFISSIAVVGHQPLWTGNALVREERVDIKSVLPNGYGDAKFACERMLDATLHAHPQHFRTMSVRLGQVAGSTKTGYWNTQEHLVFLVKSSQTLRALPDFDDQLSWTPVDLVAATLCDLMLRSDIVPDPIYHIDNPVRQPWKAAIPVLADALKIPVKNIIPFGDWVRRVRCFPGSVEKDNPAFKLVDFLDGNFIRMSCGGLLLDTTRSCAHSPTLEAVGPVSDEVMLGYIRYWKEIGFLSA